MPPRLDLNIDEKFQRKEWRLQRAGWAVWATIMVAAGCGLLGSGWLSHCEVQSVDGKTTIRYDRYLNYHHPTQIEVISSTHASNLTVELNKALLSSVQILRIEPPPIKSITTDTGIAYVFDIDDRATTASATFHLEFEVYGSIAGDIGVASAEPLPLRQYVYP